MKGIVSIAALLCCATAGRAQSNCGLCTDVCMSQIGGRADLLAALKLKRRMLCK